jgi:hypothetical protein
MKQENNHCCSFFEVFGEQFSFSWESQKQIIMFMSSYSQCAILLLKNILWSRYSSVSIVLDYRLDDWGSRVRFLARAENFSLHHHIQNGSGAHPDSYPMGTGGSFPGSKVAEA